MVSEAQLKRTKVGQGRTVWQQEGQISPEYVRAISRCTKEQCVPLAVESTSAKNPFYWFINAPFYDIDIRSFYDPPCTKSLQSSKQVLVESFAQGTQK